MGCMKWMGDVWQGGGGDEGTYDVGRGRNGGMYSNNNNDNKWKFLQRH